MDSDGINELARHVVSDCCNKCARGLTVAALAHYSDGDPRPSLCAIGENYWLDAVAIEEQP